MAVEDQVGRVLGDRAREPVAAEERPDAFGSPSRVVLVGA
jgi:hypothetical protein